MNKQKKIYIACSFTYEDKLLTQERKTTMKVIQNYLQSELFHQRYPSLKLIIYNPSTLKIKNAWDYFSWDWGKLVYEEDKKQVDNADLIIFISYGKGNNDGATWEVGYAHGKHIPILVVSMIPERQESLMVLHSAHACVDGIEGLKCYNFETMPKTTIQRTES